MYSVIDCNKFFLVRSRSEVGWMDVNRRPIDTDSYPHTFTLIRTLIEVKNKLSI
jgi:hypothetical protein